MLAMKLNHLSLHTTFFFLWSIYRKFYPISFRFDRFRFVSFDFVLFRFVAFHFYFISHFTGTPWTYLLRVLSDFNQINRILQPFLTFGIWYLVFCLFNLCLNSLSSELQISCVIAWLCNEKWQNPLQTTLPACLNSNHISSYAIEC
jgi:hypothetical protein